VVGGSLPVGSRLQFCIKYHCGGEHWDNNGGDNYVFQVRWGFGTTNTSLYYFILIEKLW
jgi:hypothetical protein